jgi:hypothetical protein
MFPLLKKSEWGRGEESVIAEQEHEILHKGWNAIMVVYTLS